MRFRFEGHDKMGRPLKGELEAANQESASSELRAKDVFALKLEPVTEDPMKTVLEHPEEYDVEAEIEQVKASADKEMPPCQEDAHCPACQDRELNKEVVEGMTVGDTELSEDLKSAMRISGQIRDELGKYSDVIADAALKEMVTEAACQAFNRAQVRRMPKGP